MAVTQQRTMTGSWELVHTNNSGSEVTIVLTPQVSGVSWGVREDTTLPEEDFVGHSLEGSVDREIFLADTETLFINGLNGAKIAVSNNA